MRFSEERDDGFVDALAGSGLNQIAEKSMSGSKLAFQPQHGAGDRARLRPGEAHHADTTASRWCGDGDDRVVQVHGGCG